MNRQDQVKGWIQTGERLYLDGEPCPVEVPLVRIKDYFVCLAWICACERNRPKRMGRPPTRPMSASILVDPWA